MVFSNALGLRLCENAQTDHIFIDNSWHSSVVKVKSFIGANCHTDHHLVVATVRDWQ